MCAWRLLMLSVEGHHMFCDASPGHVDCCADKTHFRHFTAEKNRRYDEDDERISAGQTR